MYHVGGNTAFPLGWLRKIPLNGFVETNLPKETYEVDAESLVNFLKRHEVSWTTCFLFLLGLVAALDDDQNVGEIGYLKMWFHIWQNL